MIFHEPLPFEEAVASRAVRALMPTTLKSDELKKIRPEIREQSTFSAQTDSARHVQKINDLIAEALKPEGGKDMATLMQELRNSAKTLGFDPETGGKSITNLASDARVRLIADFNTKRALSAGQYAQRQDKVSLDLWPAQEFYRAEDRVEIRDWPAKWEANGGEFFAGKSDYPQGRMIALVNDPIWEAISEFGTPFAPFDFNSGMDVRPIDRQEAEDLGLIQPGEQVVPEEVDFSEPETTLRLSPDLEEQVLEDLGVGYHFADGPDGERILTRSFSAKNSFDPSQERDDSGKWTSEEHTLFRASDKDELFTGAHLSESLSDAKEYTNNPGFGGANLHTYKIEINPKRDLDVRGGSARDLKPLAKAYAKITGDDPADVHQAFKDSGYDSVFGVLENHRNVLSTLSEHHDVIRFLDDFPENSKTVRILNKERIRVKK